MYCCVLAVGHFVWECEGFGRERRTELYVLLCVGSWTFCVGVCGVHQGVAYLIVCTVVCWQLEILRGSVRGLAGSGRRNCMNCCVLAVGHFVWECEGVSSEWRIKLYVLLCVGIWTFCVGV